MSQQKVDYYKEQKRNRQQIMKKEKMTRRLEIAVGVIVLAALVVWFGFMVAQNRTAAVGENVNVTELSLGAVDKYLNELSESVNGTAETETEEGTAEAEAGDSEAEAETEGNEAEEVTEPADGEAETESESASAETEASEEE